LTHFSPAAVSRTCRVRASLPASTTTRASRSSGLIARPVVVRSITIRAASALIDCGPSRDSLLKMEYWLALSPLGAMKPS
jgi:hypothetical protein